MKKLQVVNKITLALAGLILAGGVVQADGPAADERITHVDRVTVSNRVFRLIRFDGERVLHATGMDGAEYQIVLTPRPQGGAVTRSGNRVNLSALRRGDRLLVDGTVRDGTIRANRLQVRGALHGDRNIAAGIDP